MAAPERYVDEPEEESFSLSRYRHYIHAPLRRPLLVVVPWVAVLAAALATLYLLPKKYVSYTLILVESEKAPESFVNRVAIATSSASRRRENIRAQIYSRTMLETILGELNPYPDITSTTASVATLGKAISVDASGADGFTISFIHTDPVMAQQVVDRLASLFIEETTKNRGEEVEETVDFLEDQTAEARAALDRKEEEVRLFKQRRMGRLPEQLDANLATQEMLQRELETVEGRLVFAREREATLARSARGTSSGGNAGEDPQGPSELATLQAQLDLLSSRYTDDHPDVVRLRSRIARLRSREAAMAPGPAPTSEVADPSAGSRLAATMTEIKELEARRADLEARVVATRARIEDTPRTEQELTTLTRDYEMMSKYFTSLLGKQLDAQMAARLEKRWKGDQFKIVDPANLPEKPSFPRPSLFLLAGLVGGLFVGLSASLVAEFLDPTVKDVDDLNALLAYSVLARIPHIPSLEAFPGR